MAGSLFADMFEASGLEYMIESSIIEADLLNNTMRRVALLKMAQKLDPSLKFSQAAPGVKQVSNMIQTSSVEELAKATTGLFEIFKQSIKDLKSVVQHLTIKIHVFYQLQFVKTVTVVFVCQLDATEPLDEKYDSVPLQLNRSKSQPLAHKRYVQSLFKAKINAEEKKAVIGGRPLTSVSALNLLINQVIKPQNDSRSDSKPYLTNLRNTKAFKELYSLINSDNSTFGLVGIEEGAKNDKLIQDLADLNRIRRPIVSDLKYSSSQVDPLILKAVAAGKLVGFDTFAAQISEFKKRIAPKPK